MEKNKFTFPVKSLLVRLFGKDAYAVGGYVRDLLRGAPSPDVDILITRHSLEAIVAKLKPHGRVDLVGRSFGVIKFTAKGTTYDIALPRTDLPLSGEVKGHKDFRIASDPDLPIEKDLERRDFRTNSMALRLSDGVLIDPFDGRADTRNRTIRPTNPRAFPDDPLRVLRAARFASVLGFRMDPKIYPAAREVDLSGLSAERTNEELFKILLHSRRPSAGLEELFRLGALRQLFPELETLTLVIQDSLFHPEKDAYGHHTVFEHTKLAVDQAAALARIRALTSPRALCLLLAALFHDTGKASTTRWDYKRGRMVITSNAHDIQSEKTARRILQRFKIHSWNGFNLGQIIPVLIKTHHRASELWTNRTSVTRKAFNRLAADVKGEIELLVLLDAADRAGRTRKTIRGLDREAIWLFKKFKEMRVDKETIKPLIMGRDLIHLGVEPGPGMGRILKKLYKLQLDNAFENKPGGLERARKILARMKE